MPFAINEGVRIFYEVEGDGEVDGKSETLVMIDGFSTPLDMWREEGYTAAMSGGRRLVLIDVRGHGQSDKPHLPADYRPELLVGDVLAVLDQFGEKTAHYLGASMGAAIGFEIARRAPERLRSLTLLGYGKYGSPTELQRRFQAMGRQMEEAAVVMGAEPAWTTVERAVGPRPAKDRDRFLANDHEALLAFLVAMDEWPGFEDALPGFATPALFLVTEGDPFHVAARKCADLMPHAVFVTLAGGAHSQSSYGPENVAPHVAKFLAAIAAESAQ